MPRPRRVADRFFLHLFGAGRLPMRGLPPGFERLGLTGQGNGASVHDGRTIPQETPVASKAPVDALPTEPPNTKKTAQDPTRTHEFWALMRLNDLTDEPVRASDPGPQREQKGQVRKLFRRRDPS